MNSVYTDAHLHLVDMEARDPGFSRHLPSPDWCAAVVSHSLEEFTRSEALRQLLPPTAAGFGIHPQDPRGDTVQTLESLARESRISFIGEAGFDFFGDRPERVRNPENLAIQRRVFETQLDIAVSLGLPLLLHSRKATDILLGYTGTLRKIPSVIFHGWPGRFADAAMFLKKGVRAFFSFGTPLLRGARHGLETCAQVPGECLLSETDAPWQPPRGEPWTPLGAIIPVTAKIAETRGMDIDTCARMLRENFMVAFRQGR